MAAPLLGNNAPIINNNSNDTYLVRVTPPIANDGILDGRYRVTRIDGEINKKFLALSLLAMVCTAWGIGYGLYKALNTPDINEPGTTPSGVPVIYYQNNHSYRVTTAVVAGLSASAFLFIFCINFKISLRRGGISMHDSNSIHIDRVARVPVQALAVEIRHPLDDLEAPPVD